MEQFDLRVILTVVGVLILITGIVTEVLKKAFWWGIPTSLLTIVVAEGLTLLSGLTYALIVGTTVRWYHITAAVVAGQGIAYSAMYGYDKFIEIRNGIKKIKVKGGAK